MIASLLLVKGGTANFCSLSSDNKITKESLGAALTKLNVGPCQGETIEDIIIQTRA